MGSRSKILLTGACGFTGTHLTNFLSKHAYEVFHLSSNILDVVDLEKELLEVSPDFVIHLAGISFAAHKNSEEIYRINTIGSINLLESCIKLGSLKRVIMVSSAAVYGITTNSCMNEMQCPCPVSHYGCSKLSMELLAKNYSQYFPLTIVRPFNYTGVGQDQIFVIPKIVKAFKEKATRISLGNLNVYREYNDVRDVCAIYEKLLCDKSKYNLVNICSGKAICLVEIISILETICGYKIETEVDEKLVRKNEIKSLYGSTALLQKLTGYEFKYSIEHTLNWMLEE